MDFKEDLETVIDKAIDEAIVEVIENESPSRTFVTSNNSKRPQQHRRRSSSICTSDIDRIALKFDMSKKKILFEETFGENNCLLCNMNDVDINKLSIADYNSKLQEHYAIHFKSMSHGNINYHCGCGSKIKWFFGEEVRMENLQKSIVCNLKP